MTTTNECPICANSGTAFGKSCDHHVRSATEQAVDDLVFGLPLASPENARHVTELIAGLNAPRPQAKGKPLEVPEDQSSGAAYGIIDPDYARYYSIIRCTAWQYGYAIGMHGSFTRDLDLIAVPWAEPACEPEHLVRIILSRTNLQAHHSNPGKKPHGRTVYTLLLPAFGDPRWIDLSIMPRAAAQADEVTGATRDVLAERRRQVQVEGYESEHDDENVNDEMAALAAFYAMPQAVREWNAESTGYGETLGVAILPPDCTLPKIGSRRRELVKAGALILAEIERIDRAALLTTAADNQQGGAA